MHLVGVRNQESFIHACEQIKRSYDYYDSIPNSHITCLPHHPCILWQEHKVARPKPWCQQEPYPAVRCGLSLAEIERTHTELS